MKTFLLCSLAIFTATATLPAKNSGRGGKKESKQDKERREKREKRRQVGEKVDAYIEKKDSNNDKQLSKDEFLSDETDKEAAGKKFDEANASGDRYLNKSEVKKMLGL